MAINQNHIAEELNGIKCSIVEKNVPAERAAFLKELLEFNGYTVVIADSPAPKAAPAKPAAPAVPAKPATAAVPATPAEGATQTTPAVAATQTSPVSPESTPAQVTKATTTEPSAQGIPPTSSTPPVEAPAPPTTFTVGVTNLMFNPINAVFGRLLKTPDGHRVTPDYWKQKNLVVDEEKPYFQSSSLN